MRTDTEVCLVWLAQALQQLRPQGQKKVVGYLEAVSEEVVFETKMVPGAYHRGLTYPSEGVQWVGRGCLFWLLVSVVLSVTLTVVVNLFLFALSGQPAEEGADDTLGQGQEPRPGMLHSRAHRVPVGRDADLGGLRTGRRSASLEEHRKPLRTPCQVGSDGSKDERQLGSLPGSHTLEANEISGPEYVRAGRMEGDMQERTVQREDGREDALKLFFGRMCCVVGLLLSTGGFVVATLGESVNLSAGAVGIGLGVLGYFLGARRLGAASVVLGTAAVFFMAAASTGLIPGVTPLGHGYD